MNARISHIVYSILTDLKGKGNVFTWRFN